MWARTSSSLSDFACVSSKICRSVVFTLLVNCPHSCTLGLSPAPSPERGAVETWFGVAFPDAHAHVYSDPLTDSDAHTNTYRHTDADSESNCHIYPNTHFDPHTHPNPDSHPNAYPNVYSHSDTNTDSDANAYSHAYGVWPPGLA